MRGFWDDYGKNSRSIHVTKICKKMLLRQIVATFLLLAAGCDAATPSNPTPGRQSESGNTTRLAPGQAGRGVDSVPGSVPTRSHSRNKVGASQKPGLGLGLTKLNPGGSAMPPKPDLGLGGVHLGSSEMRSRSVNPAAMNRSQKPNGMPMPNVPTNWPSGLTGGKPIDPLGDLRSQSVNPLSMQRRPSSKKVSWHAVRPDSVDPRNIQQLGEIRSQSVQPMKPQRKLSRQTSPDRHGHGHNHDQPPAIQISAPLGIEERLAGGKRRKKPADDEDMDSDDDYNTWKRAKKPAAPISNEARPVSGQRRNGRYTKQYKETARTKAHEWGKQLADKVRNYKPTDVPQRPASNGRRVSQPTSNGRQHSRSLSNGRKLSKTQQPDGSLSHGRKRSRNASQDERRHRKPALKKSPPQPPQSELPGGMSPSSSWSTISGASPATLQIGQPPLGRQKTVRIEGGVAFSRDEQGKLIKNEIDVNRKIVEDRRLHLTVYHMHDQIFLDAECFITLRETARHETIIRDCFKFLERHSKKVRLSRSYFVICTADTDGLTLIPGPGPEAGLWIDDPKNAGKRIPKYKKLIIRQTGVVRLHYDDNVYSCFLRPPQPKKVSAEDVGSPPQRVGSPPYNSPELSPIGSPEVMPLGSPEINAKTTLSAEGNETKVDEPAYFYEVENYYKMLHACTRRLRLNLNDLSYFRGHSVMEITTDGTMTSINKEDVEAIETALFDSRIAIAATWFVHIITKESDGTPTARCQLPLNTAINANEIVAACTRSAEFAAVAKSAVGYRLYELGERFVEAVTPLQIADGLANGSLVLRQADPTIEIGVHLAVRGVRIQHTVVCDVVRGFSTPETIFRHFFPDASLFERGFVIYISLRDNNTGKRITEVNEIKPNTIIYPIVADRPNLSLEIGQKIVVPASVKININGEWQKLALPDEIAFTDRGTFTKLLVEIKKTYVSKMVIKPPQARIFLYVEDQSTNESVGQRKVRVVEREITNFEEQIFSYCTGKNVCVKIKFQTSAPADAVIRNQPPPIDDRSEAEDPNAIVPEPQLLTMMDSPHLKVYRI